MTRFQRLLRSPVYRPWFDQVHPLFWPVLYWQLECTFAWMKRTGIMDVMLSIRWWGKVDVVYIGDKRPDPSAYRPYVLTKPRFDDPVWQSDLPLAFAFDPLTVRPDATSILPLPRGRCPEGTEGAFPLPNTS
jgi:hypothetical protein